jgi:carbon starvation protein CstA
MTGALAGFAYGLLEDSVFAETIPQPVLIGAVALVLGIFLYGTWRFFSTIDELELQDNLWSSTVGFYVYATAFPLWWLLSRLDVVGEPNDWAIFAFSTVSSALAYAWRKWRTQ